MFNPFFLLFAVLLAVFPAMGKIPQNSLRIYSVEESPPISYEEKGQPIGLANEVIQRIQLDLKNTDAIYIVPWTRAYQRLLTRPYSIFTTIGRTTDREKLFSMVGPIATIEVVFFAKRNSKQKINTLEDALKVDRIAVRRNTFYEDILRQKGFKDLILTQNILQNEHLLSSGRVHLFLDSGPESIGVLKKEKIDPQNIQKAFVLMNLDLYIGFSKGTPRQTIRDWKKALQKIKENGTYEKIYRKWMPGYKIPMAVEEIHPTDS